MLPPKLLPGTECGRVRRNENRAGKKEKLLVLTKWLQKDGELQSEYSKAFKKIQGGKAERVNMSAIQVSSDDE